MCLKLKGKLGSWANKTPVSEPSVEIQNLARLRKWELVGAAGWGSMTRSWRPAEVTTVIRAQETTLTRRSVWRTVFLLMSFLSVEGSLRVWSSQTRSQLLRRRSREESGQEQCGRHETETGGDEVETTLGEMECNVKCCTFCFDEPTSIVHV